MGSDPRKSCEGRVYCAKLIGLVPRGKAPAGFSVRESLYSFSLLRKFSFPFHLFLYFIWCGLEEECNWKLRNLLLFSINDNISLKTFNASVHERILISWKSFSVWRVCNPPWPYGGTKRCGVPTVQRKNWRSLFKFGKFDHQKLWAQTFQAPADAIPIAGKIFYC